MLTLFRYFREVARLGSIRRASAALNVSPSSISRQILILERQFGTALLGRSARGVVLTPAGQLVDEFCRSMLLDFDTLRADIDDLRGGGKATIRIAAIESLTGPPLAAMSAFRDRFPAVTFRILTLPASQVDEAVRAGSSDIGLTLGPAPDPALRVICEIGEPLVLAVAPFHRLAGCPSVGMADLVDQGLAVHESEHGVRRMIDLASRRHGVAIHPTLSSSSLHVLKDFARRGLGGAIMTRGGAGAAAARGELVLLPIDEPVLGGSRVALVVRRDRRLSRALRLFTEEVARALCGSSR